MGDHVFASETVHHFLLLVDGASTGLRHLCENIIYQVCGQTSESDLSGG